MASRAKKIPALNINAKAKATKRDALGVNSPKTQVASPAEDTPADNKLRAQVNSPKAGAMTADEDVTFNAEPVGGGENSALAALVTQVDRNDGPQPTPGPAKTDTNKAKKKPKKSKGWCCCFSPGAVSDMDPANDVELEHSGGAKPSRKAGESSESAEDIAREQEGLLGRRLPQHRDKKSLIIDLDETLVHSSFKAVDRCDFIVPVEIENVVHNVYVLVRPYAVEFLSEVAKHYEIVLFTASLAKYADPLLDLLDVNHTIDYRLFRDSCVQIGYSYVKDLSRLGRKMSDMMIIDNSPQSYRFQPRNAIPITSWFDDPHDTELRDLVPVLQTTLKNCPDVREICDASKSYNWLCNQAQKVE